MGFPMGLGYICHSTQIGSLYLPPLGPMWAPRWGSGHQAGPPPQAEGEPQGQPPRTPAPTSGATTPEHPRGHLPSPLPHPEAPDAHLSSQMLAPIQQALSAQKISFLLRAGVPVLVTVREVDTGESRSHPWPGLAWAPLLGVGGVQAPSMMLSLGTWGQEPQLPTGHP